MTDGHLDATVLAHYDEGLLAPSRATEVGDHLAVCPSCAAVLGQLTNVRARLADLPAQIPMPPAVAERVDQALAAEQVQRDSAVAPAHTATVRPFRRRLPQLMAAAATVGVVIFAGYVISTSGGGDSGGEEASSAEGATQAEDGDDSGAGGGIAEDAAGAEGNPREDLLPAPAERATLTEQIQALAGVDLEAGGDSAVPQRFADDCGLVLARELGTELIGVTSTDVVASGSVLVVVQADQPRLARGVVLPACDAGLDEALRELTVPVE
jgi:hypothetical protein